MTKQPENLDEIRKKNYIFKEEHSELKTEKH